MLNWKLLGLVLLTAAFGTVGEKPGFALSLGGRCSPDGSVCVTANNGEEEPVSIIAGLRAKDADARRGAREAAVRLGAPMVEPLFDLLAEDDVACRRVAEGTLFAIVAASSAPDAPPAPRAAVSEALVAQLRGKGPARVRVYAARLLGLIGGAGAVPALAAALREAALHEAARAALQRVPGREATRALLTALGSVPRERKGPRQPLRLRAQLRSLRRRKDLQPCPLEWRPGLILALGARLDRTAVERLTPFAQRGEIALRVAALHALGQIGDPAAAPVLEEASGERLEEVRQAAVEALLALADKQRSRDRRLARRLYRRALAAALREAQKEAALLGLRELGKL